MGGSRARGTGRRVATMVCAAVLLPVSAGCGGGGASSDGPGRAELELLTRSGAHPVEERVVLMAEAELIARCMARAGFPYVVEEPPPAPLTAEEREVDPVERAGSGYGLHERFAEDDGPDNGRDGTGAAREPNAPASGMANDMYVADLSAEEATAYMRALRGEGGTVREMRFGPESGVTFPERGCEADSRAELYGDLDAWAATVHAPQFMNLTLTEIITGDPEYPSLIDEWSACMAGKGFVVESPDDAVRDLVRVYEEHGATPEVRDREIATAVADGECAREIRLPSRMLDLRHRYAADLPAEDLDALRRLTAADPPEPHGGLRGDPGGG
ncbi:hypothetical protein [Streptomyces alkaliphilus]|uniref:hypothetical protein n=1 Tax=Streptomyces alkaliphilus TaxID=1472722 RepID=UPI00118123E9|nr:hypothetical protein [Streptomyces alkaliphilus]MQS06600.1 hypothetical protein [Streptomyces alkaliphilus]